MTLADCGRHPSAAVTALVAGLLRPGRRCSSEGPIRSTPGRSSEKVCARVLEAAERIPAVQLGTTDDCGFAPFGDDVSTARETAFAKIGARVAGTELASRELGI